MTLDIEGVLGDHWPVPVFGCECTPVDDESGEKAMLETSWEAHVSAVLREQIAAVWDEGWATGMGDSAMLSNGQAEHVTPNPYRAAQVAPSRVPGEET